MLAEWKKCVEGQWTSVREEWASEREHLASAREEWESKALGDIHDTLGDSVPPSLPSFNSAQLPPVRPPAQEPPVTSTSALSTSGSSPSSSLSPAVLSKVKLQLHDTQSSLATHVDRVRALEVSILRKLVKCSKALSAPPSHDDTEGKSDDDDDASRIATVTYHELERVEEEDEEQLRRVEEEESEDNRSRKMAKLGRLRMPEPSSLGIIEDDEEPRRNRERYSFPPAPTSTS